MSNNYFNDCPPHMADGRHFTDYKTATSRNEYIKYINDVVRDDDYRMLLQCNATKFQDKEWDHYSKKNKCWESTCIHNYPTRVLPQFFPQELQAFNDSMDSSKPKLRGTCPKFADYRLTTPEQGLTCQDNVNLTSTKNIKPHELIGNHNESHGNMSSNSNKVNGVENVSSYANANSH